MRPGGFPPVGSAEAVGSEGDRGAPARRRDQGGGGDDRGGVEGGAPRPLRVVAAVRVLADVGDREALARPTVFKTSLKRLSGAVLHPLATLRATVVDLRLQRLVRQQTLAVPR